MCKHEHKHNFFCASSLLEDLTMFTAPKTFCSDHLKFNSNLAGSKEPLVSSPIFASNVKVVVFVHAVS